MSGKANTAVAETQDRTRQKVQIRIRYTGKGQPGPKLSERCDTLVDMLVEADAGTIQDRKAGNGMVEFNVVTRFADHTKERAWKIINELGLASRATVQVDNGKAGR
jgi:hypothetical protein